MLSIVQDLRDKINPRLRAVLADNRVFMATLMILVALISFGLGRQSVTDSKATSTNTPESTKATVTSSQVETAKSPTNAAAVVTATEDSVYYVASRNGQVYHLPFCSGAKRITEANKITFKSKAEAEAAGYRPAANCKGI